MHPASMPVVWANQQPVTRADTQHGERGVGGDSDAQAWQLQRRCALSPAQFGACFAGLALVSALVAAFFWAMGARFVTAFAGLEVVVVGVAFVWHAMHAADGERLKVVDGVLHVERRTGLRVTHQQFPLQGLRVAAALDGSIELKLRDRHIVLGRYAAEAARRPVLAGLRRAVAAVHG
jgi:uncharacterized membrane protein